MKIQIYSDIHNEFGTFNPGPVDSDVVVLAGDIDNGAEGLKWASDIFNDKPIIYIPGNHEYYGQSIHNHNSKLQSLASDLNIHLLNNQSVTISDVRFIGTTLWTDFNLNNDPYFAKDAARQKMADYVHIYNSDNRRIAPDDILTIHEESLAWLKKEVTKPFNDKTVIVTHHAPCIESIDIKNKGTNLSAAYASNLETFVAESGADLWIHGHTHSSNDYRIGETRVICNPRGYVSLRYKQKL